MSQSNINNVVDTVVVSSIASFSVVDFNEMLTSVGLVIAIPIGCLRLIIVWRELIRGRK
jgi:uncharacterized membrane protein